MGPVVEYRVPQQVDVDLRFPLQDVMESLYELVLRLLADDTGGARDIVLDIKKVSSLGFPQSGNEGPSCTLRTQSYETFSSLSPE